MLRHPAPELQDLLPSILHLAECNAAHKNAIFHLFRGRQKIVARNHRNDSGSVNDGER
jgi:hypothetical protein